MPKTEGPRSQIKSSTCKDAGCPIHDECHIMKQKILEVLGIICEEGWSPGCKSS